MTPGSSANPVHSRGRRQAADKTPRRAMGNCEGNRHHLGRMLEQLRDSTRPQRSSPRFSLTSPPARSHSRSARHISGARQLRVLPPLRRQQLCSMPSRSRTEEARESTRPAANRFFFSGHHHSARSVHRTGHADGLGHFDLATEFEGLLCALPRAGARVGALRSIDALPLRR